MAPYENEELFTADYCTCGLSGDIYMELPSR
jgi:hypothetical protein